MAKETISIAQVVRLEEAVKGLPEKLADKMAPLHEELKDHGRAFKAHVKEDARHAEEDSEWKKTKEERDRRVEKYFWFASIIWGVFMFLMTPVYIIVITHLLESWISGTPISLISFLGLNDYL